MGALSIMLASTAIGLIRNFSGRLFPYSGSNEERRVIHQAALNQEQYALNQQFQEELQRMGFENQKEIAYMSAMLARQTTFMNSIQQCRNAMHSRLFDDALRNFPLNISPLVLLTNAGIPLEEITSPITGENHLPKEVLTRILPDQKYTHLDDFNHRLQSNPITLSVFLAPLQVDSTVRNKELLATYVWDNAYQQLESLFVKEYNRSGERPVIFYPSAWNANAKPGMHTAELLYFFTKGMPVVVLEPRFDGTNMRVMISCWGLGMMNDQHIRQELVFDMSWNEIVLPHIYERSKRGLEQIAKMEQLPQKITDIQKLLKHNVTLYESLKQADALQSRDLCDDISNLFYVTNEDYHIVADTLSDTLGMSLCMLSDVHHLLSMGTDPLFPKIKKQYFERLFKQLERQDVALLSNALAGMYKSAYTELLLSDTSGDTDWNKQSQLIEDMLENESASQLPSMTDLLKGQVSNKPLDKKEKKVNIPYTVPSRNIVSGIVHQIELYCKNHNIAGNTLSEQVENIRQSKDGLSFLNRIDEKLFAQGTSIDELIPSNPK